MNCHKGITRGVNKLVTVYVSAGENEKALYLFNACLLTLKVCNYVKYWVNMHMSTFRYLWNENETPQIKNLNGFALSFSLHLSSYNKKND